MKLGVVTLCSRRGRKEGNLAKILHFAERAAVQGCRLVAFPEFSVNGPWVSYDPGAKVEDLRADAEPVPGPTTERLAKEAGRLGVALCVGIAETGLAGNPFNTQVVVNAGGVLHRQRKLQPTVSEVPFYRGGGDVVESFSLDGTRLGVTICADNGHRPIHERLRSQGARIILAPHAGAIKKYQNPGSSWEDLVAWHRERLLQRYQQKAKDLGLTFVYFDQKDPREKFGDNPDWIHYVSGKSAVFAPNGTCLAENAGNEESLLVVDV